MLRAGVVGLGRGQFYVNLFTKLPETELVAICARDEERAADVAERYGVSNVYLDYESFLDAGLDFVVVASPPEFHVPYSVAALERGIHVLCEIPAANSLEECQQLAEAAQSSAGKYMMAENCIYWAFIEAWREMVSQGKIGRIIYAEAEYIHSIPGLMRTPDGQPTWRAFLPPIYYCTHSLGPLLSLSGDRCVTAVGMHTGSNVDPEFGTIDMEVGLFRTEQGAIIKILTGFSLARRAGFHYYSVYGSKGCLETTRGTQHPFGTTLADFDEIPHLPDMMQLPLPCARPGLPAWASGHGGADYTMAQAFVQCLLEDTPPPIDVYRALDFSVPGLMADISAE